MQQFAAVGLAVLLMAPDGCFHTLSKNESAAGGRFKSVKIETPDAVTLPATSMAAAERVEALGQRIIEQNTFTGLTPLFLTIDVPESALFHRGTGELFVSRGLVAKCKTDGQLAAVLCRELGRMMAEKRAAKGVGLDPDAADAPPPNPLGEGTVASAPASPPEPTAAPGEPADALPLAKDLLRGAGFDPAELVKADDLLKGASRSDAMTKQIAGPAPAPKWQQ